ncbi:hypothetical protein OVY29_16535 [Sphingopyxis sp. SE2]|uniref:hypothetical protein n=1 Tax=unclassified Sphingopyxis TaxID=2614943 RepID=UPI00050E2765|nr:MULTISPECIES: hypothetical protein [unclassified Sphingopyxis]KGB56191.1 hypothetical protein FG95_02403 [Sphingopyxis sp. LC363]MDT7530268.1 hypothetical protein [Sphingopyxis sp. SE2]
MVDRPPPSRFSVVERGGRLVVIDRETGQIPPTAAERMDAHDRRMGVEPLRPAAQAAGPEAILELAEAAPVTQRELPRPSNGRNAVATMDRKQPWGQKVKGAGQPQPARIPERPALQPQASDRKTIVTAKWWDAKGPRTIELGPNGQSELTGRLMFLFFGVVIAAIVVAFIAPLLLFVGAFLLFRFGGNFLGPIGAGIVDKALAERG